jgi:hypothetical protein
MLKIKNKVFVREKDKLGLSPYDLNEPEEPLDHLLLNVMFDIAKAGDNGNSLD